MPRKLTAIKKQKTVQMIKYSLAFLLIGFVVFSCKKSSSGGSSNNTQLITSATWKYDTVAIDANKDGKPDSPVPPGTVPTCSLDNTITFKADSTGILDEGATKCNTGDPQSTPFKWYFKNNGDSLYSPNPIFGGLSGSVKVSALTSTKLEIIKEYPYAGITVNIILDMKH
jgi:hypothetical protein